MAYDEGEYTEWVSVVLSDLDLTFVSALTSQGVTRKQSIFTVLCLN